MKNIYLYIGAALLAIVISGIAAWFIFSTTPGTTTPTQVSTGFGSANNTTSSVNTTNTAANTTQESGTIAVPTSGARVFKISDGPVAAATFVQTLHPTTTLARYVMADNGHVFDLVLDAGGAVPQPISNTTLPGAMSGEWVDGGSAVVLRYLEGTLSKTVYLGFAASSTAPARIQFYPDGIISLAASPDGTQMAYLTRSTSGVNGFVTKSNGTGGKLLFSLPLKEVELRWPAPGALIVYSNAGSNVPGIAFSVDVKSGAVTPLVYGVGLTATADPGLLHIVYQTNDDNRESYAHDVRSGTDRALSFDPYPEQCIGGPSQDSLYCAVPLAFVPGSFIDAWHMGTQNAQDSLVLYNLTSGTTKTIATPGSVADGGVGTDMRTIAASPDGRYLLFISKFDSSLWGVRI